MAKVTLSIAEKNLVTQQGFILTKNNVISKVYELFGNMCELYKTEIEKQNIIPQKVLSVSAKISKGERYKELPWVMLDYPRYFNDSNTFAIRTFFWWGNFISINLLLQGYFVEAMKTVLKENKNTLQGWFLCCHQNAWEHHFQEDNFLPIAQLSNKQIDELYFIKLAKKIPLQEWDNVEIFLEDDFKILLNLLKLTNYPSDEIIL